MYQQKSFGTDLLTCSLLVQNWPWRSKANYAAQAVLPIVQHCLVQHCPPFWYGWCSIASLVHHCFSLWCRWCNIAHLVQRCLSLSGAGRGTPWQGQGPRSDKMGVKPAARCCSTTGFQISFAFNWPLARWNQNYFSCCCSTCILHFAQQRE